MHATPSHTLTLLSPARDITVAQAAIQAGADAIYIGAPRFGARQAAGNSIEDLREIVRYAHSYGVKVLVTLNTLLHEDEYADAIAQAWELYRIGVDALIIQDLRLSDPAFLSRLQIAPAMLPPIRLHASTQCDNRSAEQVLRLQAMGFRRVVLARELSIPEIRGIHDAVAATAAEQGIEPIELEAFVHGALCVSYSGRCYMSEVMMGRSANRGACAQMCRMQYDLLDSQMQEIRDDKGIPIHQRYLLSLQDMDRSAYLGELIGAGVTTFKIEGRLKDADYVTNVTAYYRQRLQAFRPNDTAHCYTDTFQPNPVKTFHRGGTDYFLHGRTAPIANWKSPKSTGEAIGNVLRIAGKQIYAAIADGVQIHNGDGLCFGDQGCSVNGVAETAKGITCITTNSIPTGLCVGDTLHRNYDIAFAKSLHCTRKIPVDIHFGETADGFVLRIGEREKTFAYPHEVARNAERAMDSIREQLSKLGDTPYVARKAVVETAPYFIPISLLNQWRREVLQQDLPSPSIMPHEQTHGIDIPPHETGTPPLMVCRYCLLYEMGHCRKHAPLQNEPKYLRLRNGKMVALQFDCKRCEMRLVAIP